MNYIKQYFIIYQVCSAHNVQYHILKAQLVHSMLKVISLDKFVFS